MRGGGGEGCGLSQPPVRQSQPHLTAPTERTPSRESARNGHSVVVTMIGGVSFFGVLTRRPLREIQPPFRACVSTPDATFDLLHSDKLWHSLRSHPCWRLFQLSGSLGQSRISDSPRRAHPCRWIRRSRDFSQELPAQ